MSPPSEEEEPPKLTEEQQFHRDLLKALAPPRRRNRFLAIINASAFLWFMSVILLGTGATYLDDRRACLADYQKARVTLYNGLDEIQFRENYILGEVIQNRTIPLLSSALGKTPSADSRFKDQTLRDLERNIDELVKPKFSDTLSNNRYAPYHKDQDDDSFFEMWHNMDSLLLGELPPSFRQDNLDALPNNILHAAEHLFIVKTYYERLILHSECTPMTLLHHYQFDDAVPVVSVVENPSFPHGTLTGPQPPGTPQGPPSSEPASAQ